MRAFDIITIADSSLVTFMSTPKDVQCAGDWVIIDVRDGIVLAHQDDVLIRLPIMAARPKATYSIDRLIESLPGINP